MTSQPDLDTQAATHFNAQPVPGIDSPFDAPFATPTVVPTGIQPPPSDASENSGLKFRGSLINLIRARHPILLVETHEADRVVRAVQDVVSDSRYLGADRAVQLFSLTKGLHAPGEYGRPQEPDLALAVAMNATRATIFVFFDLHHFLGGPGTGAPGDPGLIRRLLDMAVEFKNGPFGHTLIIVAPALTLPADLEKVVSVVDLALPGRAEISAVLDAIVAANARGVRVDLTPFERARLIEAARGLTKWEVENALARAMASDRVLDAADISLVLEEKRQTIRKAGLLEFIEPAGSIDDIGGLENLKSWLAKRSGAWLPEAADWGIPAPKGILITGVPGCGKSLTAKCMSSMWGLPLVRLDVGKIFAGLVGSSEQNMREALQLAEAVAPSILWIDEIEKGFGGATSSASGDSGTGSRVFGTFLTWMQEKSSSVFVIATANKIDALPPEFLRKGRFDEIFFVDLPNQAERAQVWSLHLNRRLKKGRALGSAFEVDALLLEELATRSQGFSGAEIEQAVIAACFEAYSERREMCLDDLAHAVRSTVPLSVTQAEQVAAVRQWAATRAVPASRV